MRFPQAKKMGIIFHYLVRVQNVTRLAFASSAVLSSRHWSSGDYHQSCLSRRAGVLLFLCSYGRGTLLVALKSA